MSPAVPATAAVAGSVAVADPAAPVTSPPDAPAQGQAEPAEGEEEEREEQGERRSWAALMLAVPSWLVSLVFHLALLLAAALFSFTIEEHPVQRLLIAEAVEEDEKAIEEIVFETDPDLEEVEITAIPTPSLSPGAIDFGDMPGMETPETMAAIGLDTTESQMVEIGALFGTGGQGMARAGEGKSGEFFGVKASGSRFVFVVDSSMSMKAGKFEAACEELYYAVSRLTDQQSFYVIFFDWDAYRMFDLKNPEPRMLRAVPENIQRLQHWMKTVDLELKTNPYDAMEFAMKLMPDAIYVLSDGAFTDGGRTVGWLKKVNLVEDDVDGTKPVVTVHTIGFYTEDNGTLKQMAETYGGTYRFVPKPANFGKPMGKKHPGPLVPPGRRP